MVLNLLLLAVLAMLAVQIRKEWQSAKVREQAFLHKTLNPTPARPLIPYVKPSPLMASSYAAVAQMNLFSQDRNSNVIVDPPPPVQEKPLPPFPVARGVMLWDGVPPTVVLSEKSSGPQRGYHPGDTIGEWTIVSIDNQFVTFEWNGKQFQKRLDELLDKTLVASEAPAAASPGAAPTNLTPSVPAVQSLSPKAAGPGLDIGGNMRGCVAGDSSPAGTIVDGMKKVVSATPFGSVCRWESAQ
jgi:hypothetical protein